MPVLVSILRPILTPILRNPLSAAVGPPVSPYDPSADALFARMTVQPSDARKTLYNNLIVSLKANGLWAKFDALWVMAAHDAQAARLNLKNANFTLSPVNSPLFTLDRGYSGNGTTSYLDTAYTPSIHGTSTIDSLAVGAYMTGMTSGNRCEIGCNDATGGIELQSFTLGARVLGQVNNLTAFTTPATFAMVNVYVATSRTTATLTDVYRNSVNVATSAVATTNIPAVPLYVCAKNNNNGGLTAASNRVTGIAHVGVGLTAADVTAANAAFLAYLTPIGAN